MPASRAQPSAPVTAVPKKKRKGKEEPPAPDTTLDSKKKAMAAEEAKLRDQMERYQRLIENAPKLAKERERRRREQFVDRASRADHRPGSRAALPDRRYELNPGAPARQKRLRAERNQGRLMFFILLLIFAGVVGWLYFSMMK
ncbi:MAG TPA: hypothetical protein VGO11_13405 [Chthoniobacteraceae bacterium]|jgi:hypothetical protein|nr:hypothetical protein [Chthoniobacteraceae bacterium]